MKKTAIAAALMVASGAVSAAPIASLDITGGLFGLGAPPSDVINPATFASMDVDGVTYTGSKPTAIGTEAFYATTSIATFQFGIFGPVAVYTSEFDDVPNGPFPAVSGDLTGNALTLDLSSWTAFWNGTAFNQGAAGVTATTDGLGNFTASWSALVVGGPFDGQIGNWEITGTVSAVPVPAAAWLFASGLVGLVGVARRRRRAA